MPCINAVSFRAFSSIEQVCELVLRAGFDTLELSRPLFFDQLVTAATRQAARDWAQSRGLRFFGFDCWVDVQPYTSRAETLDSFQQAIAFAADLDLGMIISHDSWAQVNGERSLSKCLEANVELFRQIADQAASANLQLVFEPHPDTLSMDNQWAIDFVDGIERDNVGLLYDCCHYGVGQPDAYVAAIAELGPRIRHVHFSDGDRQTYALHLPLGHGRLDLDGIVRALRSIRFSGTLTNDLYNYPLLEEGARHNAERMVEVEAELFTR